MALSRASLHPCGTATTAFFMSTPSPSEATLTTWFKRIDAIFSGATTTFFPRLVTNDTVPPSTPRDFLTWATVYFARRSICWRASHGLNWFGACVCYCILKLYLCTVLRLSFLIVMKMQLDFLYTGTYINLYNHSLSPFLSFPSFPFLLLFVYSYIASSFFSSFVVLLSSSSSRAAPRGWW